MALKDYNMIKFSKSFIAPAIVAGALSISAGIASAATVVFSPLTTADLNALTPTSNPTPSSTTPIFLDNVIGNQFDGTTLTARSPWEGTVHEATGTFSSVQKDASATFTFAGEQDSLSFIWGSPDDYNDLTITLIGGGGTFVVNGTDVQGPVGILASMVTVFDVQFTEVKFEAFDNAFEFAGLTTTPVPLPAGVLLMGTALMGFGVVRRRRKS